MIAVKLEGRLGNQLFQYAFIYATAKKLNVNFYIDKSIEGFIPSKYFTIQTDCLNPLDKFIFSIKGYKNLFSFHAKSVFYRNLERLLFNHKKIVIDNKENPSDALTRIKNGCMYEGYFQSEKYFEANKYDIRKTLTIKKKHINAFNDVFKNISITHKIVTIHIRRTDYVNLNYALPVTYYKKAIELTTSENANYIFISDDPEFIEKEFSYIINKYVSNNSEIIDLQFLINADICILSNSSFSWWGAWLNNKADKIIIAPNNWLGFNKSIENPVGIIPSEWILLHEK